MENNQTNWQEYKDKVKACSEIKEWDDLRVCILGKNGLLTCELKKIGSYDKDQKKEIGHQLNILRQEFEAILETKKNELEEILLQERLETEKIDVTLPSRNRTCGKRHLLTQLTEDISAYFRSQGFAIMKGPELEEEYNNFEALNIPEHHPARQEHDTFYIKDFPGKLLRTHTTTVQVRGMKKLGVPIRAISIGSVFRNDAIDATHSPMFHQIDIFVAEPNITIAHMKWCILSLLSFLFDLDLCKMSENAERIPVRFRPSFFPFTEPSVEVDACCIRKNGELKLDVDGDWLEILGCGMIHPNVFKHCGIENEGVQGFAAGIGIERIAMLKYGITDIRNFYEGDMRWLNHYGKV